MWYINPFFFFFFLVSLGIKESQSEMSECLLAHARAILENQIWNPMNQGDTSNTHAPEPDFVKIKMGTHVVWSFLYLMFLSIWSTSVNLFTLGY